MSLDHRLQILLDDERHRRISAVARERGVSVATVVREAIDRGLAGLYAGRRAADRRLLDAPDMDVPEPPGLRAELDALRARDRGGSLRVYPTPASPSERRSPT